MGQYYNPIAYDPDTGETLKFSLQVYDYPFIGQKLMEHAYIDNPACIAFNSLLVQPLYAIWAGDYAEDSDIKCDVCPDDLISINQSDSPYTKLAAVDSDPLYTYHYFVNHSFKEYVNIKEYLDKHSQDGLNIINPVQLLICAGNGRGGGDFYNSDDEVMKYVGAWAGCEVQLVNSLPDNYKEIIPDFVEMY